MKIEKRAAIRLTWEDASEVIQKALDSILGYRIMCKAQRDDMYYWCICFPDKRMQMSDVFKVFEILGTSDEQRMDSLPDASERMNSVNCLGMAVCELLLQYGLRCNWSETHIGEDAIWLLDTDFGG